ncbi:MAG: hypothetical protein KAS12_03875 [Candidatus Aenigmarchaeota archaeon]|nr:hypothetical protein [Candidatus Aenigmarchaeota archaeon]
MIENYKSGIITIDGKEYQNDVLIKLDGQVELWMRTGGGKRVTKEDVIEAVKQQPEQIVIGTGANDTVEVADEARQHIIDQKINLSTEPIGRAIEKYNQLKQDGKQPIGLFVLAE